MPAPSPMTKPSRPASNGRHARAGASLRVLSAFMEQNPARLSGVIAASEPPQIMASASPCWMMRAASPTAWPPVAHADTTEKLGPRAPTCMLTAPDAMLMIIIGAKNGLTRSGPRSRRIWCCSSHVCAPPMPEPMTTPTRSRFAAEIAKPASSSASRVAAIARWTKRSLRRTSLRSRYAAGSKSVTAAAIWHVNAPGSKDAIRRTPDRPSMSAFQNASLPVPIGLTTPSPVTATRPGPALLRRRLGVAFNVLHGLADRGDLLRILVRDLQVELLLQRHDELDHVERVGAEILHELGLRRHLARLHAQLLHDDRLDPIEHRCHPATTP